MKFKLRTSYRIRTNEGYNSKTWKRFKWWWLLPQFSRSVLSDSLWPHELQHARPPCPSPTPAACSNSCLVSLWCYQTISSSVTPFFFQWVSFSHQVTKCWSFNFSIWPSYQYSGPISFRIYWFDFLAVQGTLKSLLQHHNLKASVLWCSVFFTVHFSHPYITTGKTRALTRWTFVGKVMSLLFNMLSR